MLPVPHDALAAPFSELVTWLQLSDDICQMMFMLKLLVNKQEMFLFLIFGAISGKDYYLLCP